MHIYQSRATLRTSASFLGLLTAAALSIPSAFAATPTSAAERPLGVLFSPLPTDQKPLKENSANLPIARPISAEPPPLGVLIAPGPVPAAISTQVPTSGFQPPVISPIVSPSAPSGTSDRPLGLLISPNDAASPEAITQQIIPSFPRPHQAAPSVVAVPPPLGATAERPLGSLINPRANGPHFTRIISPAKPTPFIPAGGPAPLSERPLGTLITPFLQPNFMASQPPVPSPRATPSVQPFIQPSASGEPAAAETDADQPVHLAADEVTFDREKNVVTATGNVEIRSGERLLVADRISYNQNDGVVSADGNVTLLEATGERVFGASMLISGDLKDAVVENIGIIMEDRSRIAGSGARRTDGRVTELKRAVYSPCNLCKDDPNRAPLWRLKAVRVIHDKDRKIVEYRDAWLEVMGYPVAYTPYIRHPDPTVKRQSGILFPNFGNSTDFGAKLETPYFWNISPHQDMTIRPILYSNEFPVLAGEYRNRLHKGTIDTSASITNNDDDDEFETESGSVGVRGHILSEGRFNINRTWRWGYDLERASDDTYMRRYGFVSPASLDSQLFVEGFRKQNYFSARTLVFQGLAADDDQSTTPIVLPLVDFSHAGRPDRLGGRSLVDVNFLALSRRAGTDTRRLSIHPRWERRFASNWGDLYRFAVGFNADLYHVNGLARENADKFSGVTQRTVPYVTLDWRMPFVKRSGKVSQTIEPIVSAVWRPNGGNSNKMPNEDSTELEFDETNLFSVNRFTGFDRIEGGPRLNYGLKWGVLGEEGASTNFFVGQSYRIRTDSTFAAGSGLEDNFSDIVAQVKISPGSHLDLLYRTRFSSDNFSPNRNEVAFAAGIPAFRLGGNYVFLDQQDDSEFEGREELSMTATSKINRFWSTGFNAVRNISDDAMRTAGFNLTYENECIIFRTDVKRTFFEDRDLKPTDAINFRLVLKTIGEAQTAFSQSGN